ncbi:MAG: DMSO reductase [Calditrichaeota bacterium]|nr:MAG: DMSO reductase [Calditrichota bacterium]MBL1207270.1 DMSO reductase [Calditrichota bacterium]NOG47103.1 molybdopterin-dependent oxidoreductase [Calditrichota bacterium]
MDRRKFVKIATIGSAVIFQNKKSFAQESNKSMKDENRASSLSGEREAIPSACWQCVSRCAIVGYVDNDRLVKIEGNPNSLRNEGKICAKGQAGINTVYNPDRITYPLKRIGKRGSGKWEKISWDEALNLLINGGNIEGTKVKGLKTLKDQGTPEKFLFHYGRMVGSDYLINVNYFLKAYGTASIGNHDSICLNAGAIAYMLSGDVSASEQFDDAKIILNFGRSLIDAGLDHVPFIRRITKMKEKGAKLITFDVRLSNTAAKSDEWVPVKPGTDLAIVLAMCHVLLKENLYNKSEIEEASNVSVKELKNHLEENTPEWAEKISGVPAEKIKEIAIEYGKAEQGICTAFRGTFMHYNGVQAQRAIFMLDVIAGNLGPKKRIEPRPKWNYSFPIPQKKNKRLNLFIGENDPYAIPDGDVSHQIVHCINKNQDNPEIYMVYCHNPVYSNGNCDENIRVYSDTEKIPFLVSVDVALSETTELADLVLPDATYLERWTLEGKQTPDGIPEYYIRQPLSEPIGESRNFVDVACEIGDKLGLGLGFSSSEEFVEATCNNTSGIKEVGGFDYMKKHGIWHDYKAKVSTEKRSKIQLKSKRLENEGFSSIPGWMPIPEHKKMNSEELVLTTFKVNVQTHSRTQNCKWLTELYHENPAWINTKTAKEKGIENGDWIKIKSSIGEMITKAKVTQGIHPQAIAISNHAGHWAWGKYASGKGSFVFKSEMDVENKWWKEKGSHVNKIIPNVGDPIAGSMCWNDTVVNVSKI